MSRKVENVTRGFGSFHSSNFNDQIKNSEKPDYTPPEFSVSFSLFDEYKATLPEFGHKLIKKHFLLDESWTFLNHGAFGATLKETFENKTKIEYYIEKQPVRFIDRILFPQLVHSQKIMAEFIGCKPSEICFVENATTGTNAILNSLNFNENDTIYHLDTIYGAVKKSLVHLKKRCGVNIQSEFLNYPIESAEKIVEFVEKSLDGKKTKLALFDHIPSQMAFTMPIKKIIKICHSKGVRVMVDGAHALGALQLDLRELQVDYYVTNCHKWFCASKGCAVLYVKKPLQDEINGPNISHGYGHGFQSEFSYVGLKDYSPFISLRSSINFWQAVGFKNIRKYISNLMNLTAKMLIAKWDAFLLAPLYMHASMFCISLPSRFYKKSNQEATTEKDISYTDAEVVQNRLYHENKIEVPIKVVKGIMWCRCSFHIYNEIADYKKLCNAILSMKI